MEISDLDPDARGRRPWNAGNMVGAKRTLQHGIICWRNTRKYARNTACCKVR